MNHEVIDCGYFFIKAKTIYQDKYEEYHSYEILLLSFYLFLLLMVPRFDYKLAFVDI